MSNFKPGKVFDTMVAKYVFRMPLPSKDATVYNIPDYSTNYEAAQEVINRIEQLGLGRILVSRLKSFKGDAYYAAYLQDKQKPDWHTKADSYAFAICLAAIEAVNSKK